MRQDWIQRRCVRLLELAAPILPGADRAVQLDVTFVVGVGNSGKTLMTRTVTPSLAEDIATYPHEANRLWMPGMYPWHASDYDGGPLWADPGRVGAEIGRRLRHDGYHRVRATVAGFAWTSRRSQVWMDNGNLIWFSDSVIEAFPRARFVFVVRDGRVSAHISASRQEDKARRHEKYRDHGLDLPYEDLLERFAELWARQWSIFQRVRALAPTLVMHYEALCADTQASVRTIADFLGVVPRATPVAPLANQNQRVLACLSQGALRIIESQCADELAAAGYS